MPSPLGAYSAERDNSPQTQIAASRERRAVHRQDIVKHANRIASFQPPRRAKCDREGRSPRSGRGRISGDLVRHLANIRIDA